MSASQFQLLTHWQFTSPVEPVWRALQTTREWPRWWRYVRSVQEVRDGDSNNLGAINHIRWSSRLPYGIAFDVEVTEVVPQRLLRGRASGQLVGEGLWELDEAGGITNVRYRWTVELNQAWMRFTAPIAAPIFRWNHNGLMAAGAEGLAQYLDVQLLKH